MATTETATGQALPPVREVLSYERFGTAVRELAQSVADSGYVPDLVIAVARGGLPLGGALAYALGTKAVGTLNVEFYTGVDQRLADPVVLPPLLDVDALRGMRALVADDVADTGGDARARPHAHVAALLRGPDRGALRQAALGGRPRLRLAAHRPVDHVPVVRPGSRHGGGLRPSRRAAAPTSSVGVPTTSTAPAASSSPGLA